MKQHMRRVCAELALLAIAIGGGVFGLRAARSSWYTEKPPHAGQQRPAVASQHGAGPSEAAAMADLKKEAIQIAEDVAKHVRHGMDPIILTGNVHNWLGNSAEATECWKKCLALNPNQAEVYDKMASLALRKEEYEQAAAWWQKAIEVAPSMPGIHDGLGRALLSLGRPEEAARALEKEIRISPQSGQSHFLLGQAYRQLRQYEQAKKSLLTAVGLLHDDWNAYYGLATVCARLGQREEAGRYRQQFKKLKAEELKAAIDHNNAFDDLRSMQKKVAGFHVSAGRVYQNRDFLWQAEKHWKRAAELDPKSTACRLELASLYGTHNRLQEAVQVYEELCKIEPDPAHYFNLGITNARGNQLDAAERAFQKVVELAPQSSPGYRELAHVCLRAGHKLAEAKAWAQKAVELEASGPNYFILSWACDRNGDPAGARSALDHALKLDPDNPRYRRAYAAMDRTK